MRILIDIGAGPLLQMFAVFAGVSIAGIACGTAVAARLAGEEWSTAFALGSLLQAKGLTELVVLTILLDARIVSPRVFTAMILMALFSTTIAVPLARLAFSRSGSRDPIAESLTARGQ
jgi:Kef-type K+ transport system membrane component KefB